MNMLKHSAYAHDIYVNDELRILHKFLGHRHKNIVKREY